MCENGEGGKGGAAEEDGGHLHHRINQHRLCQLNTDLLNIQLTETISDHLLDTTVPFYEWRREEGNGEMEDVTLTVFLMETDVIQFQQKKCLKKTPQKTCSFSLHSCFFSFASD